MVCGLKQAYFFLFSIHNSPNQVFIIEIGRGSINPSCNEGGESQGMRIHRLTCNRGDGSQMWELEKERAEHTSVAAQTEQNYKNHQPNQEKNRFEFLFTK